MDISLNSFPRCECQGDLVPIMVTVETKSDVKVVMPGGAVTTVSTVTWKCSICGKETTI